MAKFSIFAWKKPQGRDFSPEINNVQGQVDNNKNEINNIKPQISNINQTLTNCAKKNEANTFSAVNTFNEVVNVFNDKKIQLGYGTNDIKLIMEAVSGTGNARIRANKGDLILDAQANINSNNKKLINVATPTAGTDAANKAYVDSQISNNRPPQTDLSNYYTKPEVETRISAAKRSLQSDIDSLGSEVRPKIEKNKNDIVVNANNILGNTNELNTLTTKVNTFDNRITQAQTKATQALDKATSVENDYNYLKQNGITGIAKKSGMSSTLIPYIHYCSVLVSAPQTVDTKVNIATLGYNTQIISIYMKMKRDANGPWMIVPNQDQINIPGNWPFTLEIANDTSLEIWRQANTSTTRWQQVEINMLVVGQITWNRKVVYDIQETNNPEHPRTNKES